MLNCETNTTDIEEDIHNQMEEDLGDVHQELRSFFEHGQWWVECYDCGAQWSVNDCETIEGNSSFSFEQVTKGDDLCESNS